LNEADELFDRAREGDHGKAIPHYERGLALDHLRATGRRDLAMSRMAMCHNVGADAELRRLLLLAPADAWAWVILGNLNFRQNFALAERYFRRAVEPSPQDPYAWNGMGAMYAEKRDFSRAIDPINISAELRASIDALVERQKAAGELDEGAAVTIIHQFIDSKLARLPAVAVAMPDPHGNIRELDAFLYDVRTEM